MLLPLPPGPVAALLTAAAATTAAASAALRTDVLSPFPTAPLPGDAGRRPIGVVDARLPASVSPARLRVRLFYPAAAARRGVAGWVPRRRAAWLPPSFGRPWQPHTTAAGIVAFVKGPPGGGLLLSTFAALRLRALAAPPFVGRATSAGEAAVGERHRDGNGTVYGAVPGRSGDGNGAAATSAPPLGDDRLPLILFSHGLAGSVCGYTATCTALAAAGDGALVVAVEHADGSAFATQVTGADGQPVTIPYKSFDNVTAAASAGGFTDERAFRAAQVDQRVAELTAAVAGVAAWAAGEEVVEPLGGGGGVDLAGRVDAGRVAVVGHSFGGATAFTYCHAARKAAAAAAGRGDDGGLAAPMVHSCVMLDAWMYAVPDRLLQDGVAVPTLFITAGRSSMPLSIAAQRTLLGVDAARVKRSSGGGGGDAARSPPSTKDGGPAVAWVELVGAMHNNQSDFPLVLPRFAAVRAGMSAPDIDAAEVAGVNSALTASWVTGAWGEGGVRGAAAKVSTAVASLPDPAAVREVSSLGRDSGTGARARGRAATRSGNGD